MRTRGFWRRTYSAPTPLGPYILCAVMLARSTFMASTSKSTLAMPWTASVWNSTPFSRVILPISASGCTVPTSLLANMTDTRMVLSVMAARTCSGEMDPSCATSRYVT